MDITSGSGSGCNSRDGCGNGGDIGDGNSGGSGAWDGRDNSIRSSTNSRIHSGSGTGSMTAGTLTRGPALDKGAEFD